MLNKIFSTVLNKVIVDFLPLGSYFYWAHVWGFISNTISYGLRKVLSLWILPSAGVSDGEFQHSSFVFTERLCLFYSVDRVEHANLYFYAKELWYT